MNKSNDKLICPHCGRDDMVLPWTEPDGTRLPHCICCGYVGYSYRLGGHKEIEKSSRNRERRYGEGVCVVCDEMFDRRSPTVLSCGPVCSKIRKHEVEMQKWQGRILAQSHGSKSRILRPVK